MVDPVTISVAVALLLARKIAEGAASEAGKKAWAGLSGLVRGRFSSDKEATRALDAVEASPTSEAAVQALAEHLHQHAADPGFATALKPWVEQVSGGATAIVGDNATVQGHNIQNSTVSGTISGGGSGHDR
ncbi:hypothetical protein [Kutzneria buriramensis]|uniref:Uncharacterized protein n=1 Tax=Kutzneria buriramensis TaxID=1045776 RepID=A0A3E0I068_9PSEU|nr:hypothetical protein [Kutzneria buriramensis]REH52109.1 hypothetical protein BCF44_103559 [Kutzneria buriramensis]